MSTTTMNISLPDSLKAFVDSQVASGGYTSASEYVRELLRRQRARKELDERLRSGLASEDMGEVTPNLFERLRARVRSQAREKVQPRGK